VIGYNADMETCEHIISGHTFECRAVRGYGFQGLGVLNRVRGRPKTTWRRTVEREREEGGWKS